MTLLSRTRHLKALRRIENLQPVVDNTAASIAPTRPSFWAYDKALEVCGVYACRISHGNKGWFVLYPCIRMDVYILEQRHPSGSRKEWDADAVNFRTAEQNQGHYLRLLYCTAGGFRGKFFRKLQHTSVVESGQKISYLNVVQVVPDLASITQDQPTDTYARIKADNLVVVGESDARCEVNACYRSWVREPRDLLFPLEWAAQLDEKGVWKFNRALDSATAGQ